MPELEIVFNNYPHASNMRAMQELGQSLKFWRRYRQLTQEELATAVATDAGTISRLERGIGNPTLAMLERLATELRIGLADLFLPPPTLREVVHASASSSSAHPPLSIFEILRQRLYAAADEFVASEIDRFSSASTQRPKAVGESAPSRRAPEPTPAPIRRKNRR